MSSPFLTSSGMRLPASSSLPSPTARTLPFCGFSLAVSGSTRPLAVVSSTSTARTIRRSPKGFSFMSEKPPLGNASQNVTRQLGLSRWPSRLRWQSRARVPSVCQAQYIGAPGFFKARWHSRWGLPSGAGARPPLPPRARGPVPADTGEQPSVLGAAEALDGLGHPRRSVEDLREAHHCDD